IFLLPGVESCARTGHKPGPGRQGRVATGTGARAPGSRGGGPLPPRESASNQPTPGVRMSPNVLIVDDDEMVRMNLELVLGLEGYEVATADSGLSALRVVDTARPDLVVLDILMPGLNGWDTIARLRGRADTRTLAVVALSGDRRDTGSFRRAGFNACSPK